MMKRERLENYNSEKREAGNDEYRTEKPEKWQVHKENMKPGNSKNETSERNSSGRDKSEKGQPWTGKI